MMRPEAASWCMAMGESGEMSISPRFNLPPHTNFSNGGRGRLHEPRGPHVWRMGARGEASRSPRFDRRCVCVAQTTIRSAVMIRVVRVFIEWRKALGGAPPRRAVKNGSRHARLCLALSHRS